MMNVDLVGHPFASSGRGERLRSAARALKHVGLEARIVDVGGDQSGHQVSAAPVVPEAVGDVQIFFVEAEEAPAVMERIQGRLPARSRRIIQLAWPFSEYPSKWARDLQGFDEIWAPSAFVRDAVSGKTGRDVFVCPPSVDVRIGHPLGRRYFGIPESAYVFLSACDLRHGLERKNPRATLEAFHRMVEARPERNCVLALRVEGASERADEYQELRRLAARTNKETVVGTVALLAGKMTDGEFKNLLWSADSVVSLHRSRGFGQILAEAMFLAKPVVATAYSGNLEFMTAETACLVAAETVPVPPGVCPPDERQRWAEADLAQATDHMLRLLEDRRYGRDLGARAGRQVRTRLSCRAVGLCYLDRLGTIGTTRSSMTTSGAGLPPSPPATRAAKADASIGAERIEA